MRTLLLLLLLVWPLFAWQTTFEAENASVINKAVVETEHSGYTGDGYVNFDNEPGGYITFKINMLQDSMQSIQVVYANGSGSNRQMELMINNSLVDTLNFEATTAWSDWDTVLTKQHLKNGLNTIQLTGISALGGPNLDKVLLSGLLGPALYQLVLNVYGGSVLAEPDKEFYNENEMVTLTAWPDDDYLFKYWLGDLSGSENPVTITMDSDKNITALCEFFDDTSHVSISDSPVGFASLGDGTFGGAGGDTISISDAQTMVDLMLARQDKITTPLVIQIHGIISGYNDMIDIKRTANISVIGMEDNAGFQGFGMKLVQSQNIVIRNLTFADCKVDEKDGLTVDGCQNIWIDHCTFTDSPSVDPGGDSHDGLLDIKRGSHNVTVSYNYFNNHRKTALLGHSVNETADTTIKVTYFANWFDGTNSRHPRVRYGKVHLLNNLYTNITGYGVGVTCAAQVLLEGNYFENTSLPVLISQVNDFSTLSGDPAGYLKAVSNITIASGDIVENMDSYSFTPGEYYEYQAIDSFKVKSVVMASAGAGKLDIATSFRKKEQHIVRNTFLSQNYPNPFNPATIIKYLLTKKSFVSLKIYDNSGRLVSNPVQMEQSAGEHNIIFNGHDLTSGVYFYQLKTENFVETKKMLLLK